VSSTRRCHQFQLPSYFLLKLFTELLVEFSTCDVGELVQMERISADFEKMWQSLSTEQRLIYGRQYIDHHLVIADACRWAGNPDVTPVIRAMADALFSVKPRSRYMVHGGAGKFDLFCVSSHCALSYSLKEHLCFDFVG